MYDLLVSVGTWKYPLWEKKKGKRPLEYLLNRISRKGNKQSLKRNRLSTHTHTHTKEKKKEKRVIDWSTYQKKKGNRLGLSIP